MRSSLVMSLIGAASMAVALLAGCGDDDAKLRTSSAGQSCVRTSDCADGLSCVANVCYKAAPPTGGEAGDTSTPLPTKGGEGESCNSRLDCADGLGCFNNRCTRSADSGDAGAGNVGATLGARGETCRVNGDCGSNLICVNVGGTGVCDLKSFGLADTGKTCSGECLADSDCCQLPVALHTATIVSCKDIADAITVGAIDCTAPATPTAKTLCFEQATYCDGCKDVWACDEGSHSCVYQPKCVVAAGYDAPDGCPSNTRLRSTLGLSCNPTTLDCTGATAAATCNTDAKCVGKLVVDGGLNDTCTEGECICYEAQCYRPCARDIDCGTGKVCDSGKDGTNLCVAAPTCTNDTQCAVASSNAGAKCNEGTCKLPCKIDRDCSPSGVNGSFFNSNVCGADGFCGTISGTCDETTQCPSATLGGLKPFCVDKAAPAGGAVWSSITE